MTMSFGPYRVDARARASQTVQQSYTTTINNNKQQQHKQTGGGFGLHESAQLLQPTTMATTMATTTDRLRSTSTKEKDWFPSFLSCLFLNANVKSDIRDETSVGDSTQPIGASSVLLLEK